MSNEALLQGLGQRLAAQRLAQNLTQEQVAEESGLGLRTVQRLELGAAATQLSGFVRVCRVLGLLGNLDHFIPEPAASPMAQLKQRTKTRRRATGTKTTPPPSKPWSWGESS